MIKPIQILSDLISTTAHIINVSTTVDNGDGTYTLTVDNTFYLTINKTIIIGANEYLITDFTLNQSLTLKGTLIPNVTTITIDSPTFLHGTPKMVNNESQFNKSYPFIWLVEFLESDYNDSNESAITTTLDLNLLFLTDIDYEDFTINDHYTNAIYPMSNEIDFIIKTIKKRRDLFGELDNHKVINHTNFGVYLNDKGYDAQILTDQLSGCQLKISLPYVVDLCNTSTLIVSRCQPVTIIENGNLKEYIESGGTFSYTSGSGADATEIIKDSAGTTLYTDIIASGGTNTRTINDATVSNSDASYTDVVLAEGSLILPDETYNVYVDGVLQSSVTSPTLKNETINILWQ